MQLASFQHDGTVRYGVVEGDFVLDISASLRGRFADLKALIAGGDWSVATQAAVNAPRLPVDAVSFLPIIPNPDKILCVGLNYRPHREETGREESRYPTLFTRFASSVVGHGEAMVAPAASHHYDYEGELAVVIGRRARRVSAADAMACVAGYACFNDGSVRDYQRHSTQFTPGKNFVASGSFGPWMVTRESVPDVGAMHLETQLNGVVMQSAHVRDLDFDIPYLISYISLFTELVPGDVIATGTPGGVGYVRKPPVYLTHGDLVEVSISGVGTLRNIVVAESMENEAP